MAAVSLRPCGPALPDPAHSGSLEHRAVLFFSVTSYLLRSTNALSFDMFSAFINLTSYLLTSTNALSFDMFSAFINCTHDDDSIFPN